MTTQVGTNNRPGRLISLDALRGFTMLWIIGAKGIVDGLNQLNFPGALAVSHQLSHSSWDGFTFYDLIFPMFIFIMGVSLVFSLRNRIERGDSRRDIFVHVLKRTIFLFLLGVFYNGGLSQSHLLENLRLTGVLQRIAVCYLLTATLVLTTSPRTLMIAAAGILVGYWAVMMLVPVPGFGRGVLTPEGNMAAFVDNHVLPGRAYWETWDPEGILSTLPATATCLLGTLTGYWLRADGRSPNLQISRNRRAVYLVVAGLVTAGIGALMGLDFPIIKSIWTSSFALLTGGLSAVLLGVFYWVIDVRGRQKWAFPFVVIGANAIAIYIGVNIIPFDEITQRIAGGDLANLFGTSQTLFLAIGQLVLEWMVLLWMYRRKVFIRI